MFAVSKQPASSRARNRDGEPVKPRDYDTTIARIAGNIAAGLAAAIASASGEYNDTHVAHAAVTLARAIVAEVKRTEPPDAET